MAGDAREGRVVGWQHADIKEGAGDAVQEFLHKN